MPKRVDFVNNKALDEAKKHLDDYLASLGRFPNASGMCRCINPAHQDDTPSMSFDPVQQLFHCFACGVGGSIVDAIMLVEGLNQTDASKRAIELYASDYIDRSEPRANASKKSEPPKKQSEPPKPPPNFHDDIIKWAANFDHPDCIAYLQSRGFVDDDLELLRTFRIGFDVQRRLLIIPHSDLYYTARPIDNVDKQERFKFNPKGAKAEIFNAAALYSNDVVVVCEGAIDALSLLVCGIPAIGLPGVNICHKELIAACLSDHPFADIARPLALLLAFDNDKSGQDSAAKLGAKFDEIELLHSKLIIPSDFNDINDWFKSDRAVLASAVEEPSITFRAEVLARRLSIAAHKDPVSVLAHFKQCITDSPEDADIAPLVFDENALIAAAKASEDHPADFSSYKQFIKAHGADMSLFAQQINKHKRELHAAVKDGKKIAPLNDAVANQLAQPPVEVIPPPNFPDGSEWNFNLPPSFRVEQDGIYQEMKIAPGMYAWVHVSYSVVNISKLVHNIDDHVDKIQLTAYNHGYGWRTTPALQASEIKSAHKVVALSDYGLDVHSVNAKSIISYLSAFQALNPDKIPQVKTVNQPGWQADGSFVYPNVDGPIQLDDRVQSALSPIFQSAGDKQPVIDLLQSLKTNQFLMLSLGAALAAPLVKVLKCQNIAVHIYGNTGSGKSTINRLVMSLFGDVSVKDAIPTADTTKVGAEQFFGLRHDLPAFIDDIDTVSDPRAKAILREMPYQFVNKTGRLRGKKNGGYAKPLSFRGSLVTNGESTLTTSTSRGGGKRRVIELQTPDKILDLSTVMKIESVIKNNYGLFGRQWIDYIQQHSQQLNNIFTLLRDGKDGEGGFYSEFHNKIPLHIDNVAAMATALVAFFHMLGFDERDVVEDWACDIIKQLPHEIEIKDSERAKHFIRDWILSHPKNFSHITEALDDNTCRPKEVDSDIQGQVKFGVWRKKFIAVFPSVLYEALDKEGFASDRIIKDLAADGFIIRSESQITRVVRIDDSRVRMICFDIKNFEAPVSPDDEPIDDGSDGAPSTPRPESSTPRSSPNPKPWSSSRNLPPLKPEPEGLTPQEEAAAEEFYKELDAMSEADKEASIKALEAECFGSPSTKKSDKPLTELQQLAKDLSHRLLDDNDAHALLDIETKIESFYGYTGRLVKTKECEEFILALDPRILDYLKSNQIQRKHSRLIKLFKKYGNTTAKPTTQADEPPTQSVYDVSNCEFPDPDDPDNVNKYKRDKSDD